MRDASISVLSGTVACAMAAQLAACSSAGLSVGAYESGDETSEGLESGTAQGDYGTASGGDSGTGLRLDVSAGSEGLDDGDIQGCEKVDFLFVVDNSGSMEDEQDALIGSFPGFLSTIREVVAATDYHIMVIATDDGRGTGMMSTCLNGVCECTPAPICCEEACDNFGVSCNGFDCDALPTGACDFEYGSGRQYDADGTWCNLADERRYMLESQPGIDAAFACVARVGTYGSGEEKPMQALGAAVSEAQNQPGGCDAGFLRDDAILVVTFITDEEDDNADDEGSLGDPADWAAALLAAKHDNPEAVVLLGLFGDGDLPSPVCPSTDPSNDEPGAEPAPRLRAFVETFPHGSAGSVCAEDYTGFFAEAVDAVDLSCDEFVPPA